MVSLSSEDQQFSRVADFYNNKTVFVTGAAGFIGSVLLETLLRCCPGIESIYILLRPKKNVRPEERKGQIFYKKIFEKFRVETPDLLEKVHVISGDVSLPNLGMTEDDIQLLIDKVSIVFHCAATIHFTKPLKFVLLHNVLSLNSIIELCRKMRKFEALVYTSTAYCNCNHIEFTLKEEVYRLPFGAEKFLDVLKNDDDEKLQEMYSHCKPDWPNTYTFSKCLAENVIQDTASDLPIVIIRPSIVIGTWKHPIPGYLEENSGYAAMSLGIARGFVKVLYADPNCKLNLVPVDIVANAHVVAAWSVGTKRSISPLVVHCTATEKMNVKLSEYTENLKELSLKFPLPHSFQKHTRLIILPYKYLYYIVVACRHYLPAIALDGTLKISGKKPRWYRVGSGLLFVQEVNWHFRFDFRGLKLRECTKTELVDLHLAYGMELYSMYRFYDSLMNTISFFVLHPIEMERNNLEYLDKLIHPEERKELALDFKDTTFLEIAMKMPEASPFYEWNRDEKSPSERQRVKYRTTL